MLLGIRRRGPEASSSPWEGQVQLGILSKENVGHAKNDVPLEAMHGTRSAAPIHRDVRRLASRLGTHDPKEYADSSPNESYETVREVALTLERPLRAAEQHANTVTTYIVMQKPQKLSRMEFHGGNNDNDKFGYQEKQNTDGCRNQGINLEDGVFVYIDDILVRKADLLLEHQKCAVVKDSVSFLDNYIDVNCVRTNSETVKKIVDYPAPKNVGELGTSLEIVSYHREFIAGFSKAAKAPCSVTGPKVTWKWTEEEARVFEELKRAIAKVPVCAKLNIKATERRTAHPWIAQMLVVEILKQFCAWSFPASSGLKKAEKSYHITDLEALAVELEADKHFKQLIEDVEKRSNVKEVTLPRCDRKYGVADFLVDSGDL
ncbi:hypothetical protein ANCCEY_05959 [Ancylostoma ceylanicum]|uniref:Reverse transcriptase/retrotransposon-derived protein RNase H-like domain-containing protein n=1 Tax=Ancylostoma ceylanicum TaxID=53326 RepID=A0A0D6M4W6_9BILA|nr:hypothetical protein ANCCEY_05959 [Ancylostoma ceylanicum]